MPGRSASLVALGALALGCVSPRTSVLVVVRTDLAIPDEIASVRAEVGDGGCASASCIRDFAVSQPEAFPFSFAIEPGTTTADSFAVAVTARDAGGRAVVSRHVRSRFVRGRTLRLVIDLSSRCRATSCAIEATCDGGVCVPIDVDPATLVEVTPGHELEMLSDVGPPVDAAVDAPPFDAAGIDAPREVVGSCRDLPGLAPTGSYVLDPDGAGGAAPFEAWCENDLDGGGWTLLLKVDPASGTLGYDAAAWLGTTADASADADESVGDALLLPYWLSPVSEIRLASEVGAVVVTLERGGTLRSLMGAPVLFTGAPDFAALVPEQATAEPCSRAGVDVGIPEVAPELRVRLGWVGAAAADCGRPSAFIGVGAGVVTMAAGCASSTISAGGARVCGGMRRDHPYFVRVYGR